MGKGSFRDIRLFVAAYEERSFTAAAKRENATQSGVSQHVRKLEDSLGVSLFVRNKGRVVATPAGDSYYRHCIELLNGHAKATAAVRRHGAGLQGDIVIGLSTSGKSRNVLEGMAVARAASGICIGMTGFDGGLRQPWNSGKSRGNQDAFPTCHARRVCCVLNFGTSWARPGYLRRLPMRMPSC